LHIFILSKTPARIRGKPLGWRDQQIANYNFRTANDFHIGLGFDKTLADQILQTKPQPIFGKPAAMDKTSVVAEMTPHTRGAKWTFARVIPCRASR